MILATLLLLAADPALPPVVLEGDYEFQTVQMADGHPACTEHWTFGSEGTVVMHSGEETATKKFHIEDGNVLVTTEGVNDGKPDCTGRTYPGTEPDMRLMLAAGVRDDIMVGVPKAAADGGMVLDAIGRLIKQP